MYHEMQPAEDFPLRSLIVFDQPPTVRNAFTTGVYVAPSDVGLVVAHRTDLADGYVTGHAVVRFRYKTPLNQLCWSHPLELPSGVLARLSTEPSPPKGSLP